MQDVLRKEDTVCRFGGDEFVILIEELDNFEYLQNVLHKIQMLTNQKFQIDDTELSVSMSIGASIYPNDAQTPEGLLKCADEAMYRSKNSGKNRISFFQNDIKIYSDNRALVHTDNAYVI
jgi:diguanylate cyclase (GGDEF)-like protein